MLRKPKLRKGCTVSSSLTWPSVKKSDGIEEFVTKTGLVNDCSVLPETQFVVTRLRVETTRILSLGGSLLPIGAAGERPEFDIKPLLGAPFLTFHRGYLLKSFPPANTSVRQRGFEIRIFPLLGELPKVIKTHLPAYLLLRWQLGARKLSSITIKSLDPIVVTVHQMGFP